MKQRKTDIMYNDSDDDLESDIRDLIFDHIGDTYDWHEWLSETSVK